MNVREEREREMITEQAAEWFVANRDSPDGAQRAAFAAWLRKSPPHAEEYVGLMRLARDLQKAVADPKQFLDALLEQARSEDDSNVYPIRGRVGSVPASLPRRGWLFTAAAASVAILAVAFLWLGVTRQTPQSAQASVERFLTRHGQQLEQRLADGSLLHLNTDTSVAVHYERGGRWAEIEHGQAAFEVAHDPTRPFRVTAGSAEVIAVGTQFDVYLQGESTLVTVVEGRVTVGPAGGHTGAQAGHPRTPMQVSAGQQVRVVRGELPLSPSEVDTHRTTAWLHHQIVFEHESLAVVAAEFNRYTTTPIEIEKSALRELLVSGVFNVDDTESFVAFLRSLDGVDVEVTPTRIRVFKT